MLRPLYALLGIAAMSCAPSPAPAAESYDNCAGTIASLPAVITTQGVWCLKGDLATDISTGTAITIDANNVTIDCNGFKVGGLAAGAGTLARGIAVTQRLNAVVRNCNVRGFRRGIQIAGGGAYQIEDNRIEGSTLVAIEADTAGVIRRNLIYDTGGAPLLFTAYGIIAGDASVIDDNVIDGVTTADEGKVYGIVADGTGPSLSRNRLRNVQQPPFGEAFGIRVGFRATVDGNHVVSHGNQVASGAGIECTFRSYVANNIVIGFSPYVKDCQELGNLTGP